MIWALTTTVLGRSLLRLRQAEVEEQIHPTSGRASPFGIAARGPSPDQYSINFDDQPYDSQSSRQSGELIQIKELQV